MDRAALEHVLRAAAAIANEREFVYPRHAPEKSDLIDGAIGELSAFHQTFGYYAHGVDETTATLPAGWAERLVPVHNENTAGATGWCLEVHDLAVSKLVAGRERDLEFLRVLVRERMVDPTVLRDRLGTLSVPEDRMEAMRERLLRVESPGTHGVDGAGKAREL